VKRISFIVLSAVAISFGFLAAPLRAQFAYVANGAGNNLSAFSIAANGALTPVPGSPFVTGFGPTSVAVDPTGKFAYVANVSFEHLGTVSGYSIDHKTGALTPVRGSPFAAGNQPSSVAVDPTGRFAYVANLLDNNVSGYSIGSNGALTPVPGSPFATGTRPRSVAVDPTGQFAYVANIGADNVSAYSIGFNGALTPVPGSPFATGGAPISVAVDLTGKFAYVANSGADNVSAYSIGSNGALTPVPGSPFATGFSPFSVAVDPTGRFAYVANLLDNNVSSYSIAANGALTPVPGSPFATGFPPFSVAVDPTGKFAYVANGPANNVSAFSIAANGALTPVPGSPFAAGLFPLSVAITPLVPFAASFAKLEISKKGFDLNESFTLGANSNGINPVTEDVTLQIGTFSVTIPAGSFQQKPNGRFDFKGIINDVKLKAQIVPLGNNIFTFNAEGKGVDLTGLTNPVTVVLTIGTDSGTTAVRAEFEKRKKHHQPDDNGENTQPDDNGDEHE
jgi:DNA-binding beta-propeller fold protein YncE